MGPAPVTTTFWGSQRARPPMRSTCSQALATTLVGSMSTPSAPSPGSIFTAYSGMEAVTLGAVPVVALDAVFGVQAVVTEIPLPHRAVPARHGVGEADDADDEVPGDHGRPHGRVDHAAERLVAQDEAVASRRRPPVGARHDLHVGPAHPHGQSLHEDRTVGVGGFVDVFEAGRTRRQRLHRERLHRALLFFVLSVLATVGMG